MKKTFLVILILAATSSVFAARHKKAKKHTSKSNIISVSMHRTACFGRCPDYIIELSSDGMATYTGIRFTQDSGVYTKNIGTAATNKLMNDLTAYRIDTCQATYPQRITDVPGIYYIIQYKNGRKQQIANANFGPVFLKEIALRMDSLVKVDASWTKDK